jgi:hypothetical protein
MNSFEFVELQKKLGLDIVKTENNYWVVSENNTAVSTPSLESSTAKENELSKLFSKGVNAVTFLVEIDTKNSYEYIFEGDDYSIEQFKSKIRNQIRKGLKSCEIRKPTFWELNKDGVKLNQEILSKHGREVSYLVDEDLWEQYSKKLLETKDVYTYGAFVEDKLVGYVFFIKVNDKYYVYHPYASRKYSKEAPMNALLFTAINDFIQKDGNVAVSYGLASFFEKPGLDHFKKGMLFYEKPITRVVAFPKLKALLFNNFLFYIFSLFQKNKILENKYLKYKVLYEANSLYKYYISNKNIKNEGLK